MNYTDITLAHNTTKEAKTNIMGSGFNLNKFGETSKVWGMDYKKDLYGISFSATTEPYEEDKLSWKGLGNTATIYAKFNSKAKPLELGFYTEGKFWKDYLHDKYKTTNGKILAKRIMRQGYNSVITKDEDDNIMEVVVLDLSSIDLFGSFPKNENKYLKNIKDVINEISWTDLYPKDFLKFRKDYTKKKDDYRIYVNFSNFNDNTIDKNPYDNPNHTDPVGIYGYPLKYVIDYPADIWYGRNAKYLRILQDTSKNPLYITEMTDRQIEIILNDMGFRASEIEDLLKKAKKYFGYTGSTAMRKAFMSVVQIENVNELSGKRPFFSSDEKVKLKVRSGKEQTALFLKAGFDCIIDSAKNQKSAVINPREPQQTIFLTRDSFKIIDIYELRSGKEDYMAGVMSSNDEERLSRKLASMILDRIDGDKLLSQEALRANQGGFSVYWTNKGRRISIRFEVDDKFYQNRGWGEKIHKENKWSDHHKVKVMIYAEKKFLSRTYATDTTFEAIARDIGSEWDSNPDNPDFVPENQESYFNKEEQDRIDRNVSKLTTWFKNQIPSIKELCNIYGFSFTDTDEEALLLLLYLVFIRVHVQTEDEPYSNQLFTNVLNNIKTDKEDKYSYDKFVQSRVSFNEPQIEQFRKLLEKMFNESIMVNDGYKEMTLGNYFKTRALELGDKKIPIFDIFDRLLRESKATGNEVQQDNTVK